MLILSALVFVAVTLGLAALFFWLAQNKTEQRLQTLAGHDEKSEWKTTLVDVVGPFARLSTPTGNWESSPLRLKFLNAGIRHADARFVFFGIKTLLPFLFAGVAFLALRTMSQLQGMTLLMWLMISALIGCYLPNFVLYLTIRSRKREIFENFPDAADLMLVCIEAGLSMDASLTRVADEIRMKSMALAEELQLTNLEVRAGGLREKALHNLALRTGIEEISVFATMLTQADRFGTSIGESMRVFSDDLRHKRQMRAEELAAKVPTKMLFPVVVFIFPSIIMVVLGPAIIQVVRIMLPLLAGNG
jgi:tight adherence protein C